ncbi:hypothetical protein [Acinetobacter courvalinii]|uniref:hypothetical protein n=1 Tax=Acinetobacter courvalinii TaxID=280147 RepID=UPI0002CF662C|nr:hypothetical protein [Acinetobacter courvalinii]ENX06285.1 hypothetical protein F898_03231 [Acinetobacter courvalinii]
MSNDQEDRRRNSWENGGREQFEPTFERLRELQKQIESLPEGSKEREDKQKEYDSERESAFEAYDKATDF